MRSPGIDKPGFEKAGFDKERLDRTRVLLEHHVEHSDIPGLVALASRGRDTYVEAFGVAAADGTRPMTRDSIFRIASMTKPVTAVAAMILVEECALHLDEPVERLLPELADRRVLTRFDRPLTETVPATRAITVRDLLTFRLGFGVTMVPTPVGAAVAELDLFQGPPQPSIPPAPDEWIKRFGTLPLMHQPGERWMYHFGADVLGVLVARAADQPLGTFFRERIFEPLGMRDTGFSVPVAETDRFVTGYWDDIETGVFGVHDEPVGGQWNEEPAFPSGGGGLVSTVDDFHTFAQMLLHGGVHAGERVLSRASVGLMTTNHLTPEQQRDEAVQPFLDGHGWGFGVAVMTHRSGIADNVGKYGWTGGLGTSWANDPVEGVITILLTQRAFTSPTLPPVHEDFSTSVYQAV
jgi:CubicO group peptidase (beta-lactamase class C family)